MDKLLRTGILIMFGMLIICVTGACRDDPPEKVVDLPQSKDDVPPPLAVTVVVDPAPGNSVPSNAGFTLTFSEEVMAVTVNGTPASGSGLNWKVAPILGQGAANALNIRWVNQDGSASAILVGPYAVVDNGGHPPTIVAGTVADGSANVDPAPINAGGFRFDFDEPITGTIKLTDEAGVDLNWIGNVGGQTATLAAVAGQELTNETTYKIEINVGDGSGNQLRETITFVTKPK